MKKSSFQIFFDTLKFIRLNNKNNNNNNNILNNIIIFEILEITEYRNS